MLPLPADGKGFRIADWWVEPRLDRLSRGSVVHKVEPRTMRVLLLLAEQAGEVVSTEQILERAWPDVVVTSSSVYQSVALLRKLLGDDADRPTYLETIPRKGYRLIAAVSESPSSSANVSGSATSPGYELPGWPDECSREFDGLGVLRRLGAGSMAQVFLAREAALERLVAVKVLKAELAADSVSRARFEREALAAARVSHPNVAAIYRVGQLTNGIPYIAQEFIEGRTLAEVLSIEGARDAAHCRRIVTDLAGALAAADSRRVIHRDVRPANVLIERDTGRVVLTDFGIAGLQEAGRAAQPRLTRDGEKLGDPRYASPEQIRGEALTPASDIYSLGVTAYELLTLRGPYDPEQDLVRAHVGSQPIDLAQSAAAVPADLAHILRRCLAKRPEDRPTAAELVRLLTTPSEGSALGTVTQSAEPLPAHRSLSYWWIAAAALVAVAAVVLFVVAP